MRSSRGLLALALAAAACDEPASPTPASFCDGLFGGLASHIRSCCSADDQATAEFFGIAQFVQAYDDACSRDLAKSISGGRASFDTAQASQCLLLLSQALSASDCSQVASPDFQKAFTLLCRDVIDGQEGEGQVCAADYECKPWLSCLGGSDGTDGVCVTPGSEGAKCGPGAGDGGIQAADFPLGLHPACADAGFCALGRCAAPAGPGGACVLNAQCALGLACHLGTCGTAGPAPAGAPCADDLDCVPGLYCDTGSSSSGGSCTARKPAGAACVLRPPPLPPQCLGRCVTDGGFVGTCAAWCGSA